MGTDSTFGLRPEQLAQILRVAVYDERLTHGIGMDQAIAEALQSLLESPLLMDLDVLATAPATPKSQSRQLGSLLAKPMTRIFLDPGTPLKVLNALKGYYKKLASSNDSSAIERATSTTLYYTAIGSALLFHGEKISTLSQEVLASSFDMLLNNSWMEPKLAKHLRRARAACEPRGND